VPVHRELQLHADMAESFVVEAPAVLSALLRPKGKSTATQPHTHERTDKQAAASASTLSSMIPNLWNFWKSANPAQAQAHTHGQASGLATSRVSATPRPAGSGGVTARAGTTPASSGGAGAPSTGSPAGATNSEDAELPFEPDGQTPAMANVHQEVDGAIKLSPGRKAFVSVGSS
jgi:hypothetical protein